MEEFATADRGGADLNGASVLKLWAALKLRAALFSTFDRNEALSIVSCLWALLTRSIQWQNYIADSGTSRPASSSLGCQAE